MAPHTVSQSAAKRGASVGHAILNARHMDAARGQFLSEEPVSLAIGDPQQLKRLTGQDQQQILADPQLLNSYSYARGNPISQKDPNGTFVQAALLIGRNAIIGGGTAGLSLYASNIPLNMYQGKTGQEVFANNYSASDYEETIGKGAVVGAINPKGVIATGGVVALVDVLTDIRNGRRPDLMGASVEALTAMAGSKVLQQFAKVRGVEPSTFGSSLAFGAHTQRVVQENVFQSQLSYVRQALTAIYASLMSIKQSTQERKLPDKDSKKNNK